MRSFSTCLLLLVLTVGMCAQQPSPSTPNSGQAPTPGHTTHSAMHHHAGMQSDMHAQVQKMRATLDKMKANLATIKDPTVKQQAQLDVDLWETMVQHMEGMAKMMSGHPDMGMMGNMHHEDMGCCSDDKAKGPDAAPQPTPAPK